MSARVHLHRLLVPGHDGAVERFTVMPRGGHFAALEQPELLAKDLTGFLAYRG